MSIYCQVSSNILCLIIKVLFKIILNLLVFWVLRRITLNTSCNKCYLLINTHVCQVKKCIFDTDYFIGKPQKNKS